MTKTKTRASDPSDPTVNLTDLPTSPARDPEFDRDPSVGEFFGFEGGSSRVFTLNKKGMAITRKLEWIEQPSVAAARSTQLSLPITIEGSSSSPMLPVGLTIISGGTAKGKSSFVRALAKAMSTEVDVIRLLSVEPYDTGEDVTSLPSYSSADAALVQAIAGTYANQGGKPRLYVIDSLRAPLFETTGPAGARGVIMPFFTQLTRVSTQLAKAGISMLATVNPMNEDREYTVEFLKKLSASVPALITIESSSSERIEGFIELRPVRTSRPFVFEVGGARPSIRLIDLDFDSSPIEPRSNSQRLLVDAISSSPI